MNEKARGIEGQKLKKYSDSNEKAGNSFYRLFASCLLMISGVFFLDIQHFYF